MKQLILILMTLVLFGILLIPAFSQEDMQAIDNEGFTKKQRPPAVFRHDPDGGKNRTAFSTLPEDPWPQHSPLEPRKGCPSILVKILPPLTVKPPENSKSPLLFRRFHHIRTGRTQPDHPDLSRRGRHLPRTIQSGRDAGVGKAGWRNGP